MGLTGVCVIGTATYLMLWPEDGRMMKVCGELVQAYWALALLTSDVKEDIRAVYDGSIFHRIAEKRETKLQQHREQRGKPKSK